MNQNETALQTEKTTDVVSDSDKTYAIVSYSLNLATILLGITCLVALVLCYVKRGSSTVLLEGHYRFQIRTFWISFLGGVVLLVGYMLAFALMFLGIGYLLLPVVSLAGLVLVVWFYARMIMGLVRLTRNEPIKEPTSWLFG